MSLPSTSAAALDHAASSIQRASDEPERKSVGDPADADEFSHHHSTLVHALTALQHMMARQLPADPASFEIWYTYAARTNAALNRAIDAIVEQGRRISAADLDDIHVRFFASGDTAERTGLIGDQLAGKVAQVSAVTQAVIRSTAGYQTNLAGARHRLARADSRDALRAIVDTLACAIIDMELQNRQLQASLVASKREIDDLAGDLAVLRADSVTDALTALANRRRFDHLLEQTIGENPLDRKPLSLLMCDVDHFKRFNDVFGHPTGDQVLRLIGKTLRESVRGRDLPARYGGEEFAIILPETTLAQAVAVGDNIRGAIARNLIRRGTGESLGQITLSIGAAEFQPGETAQSLIKRADDCLYAAKRRGRNCTVSACEAGRAAAFAAEDKP